MRAVKIRGASFAVAVLAFALGRSAGAQELQRVSVNRPVIVGGVSIEQRGDDVIGLARVKFHGLIAAEMSAVGYQVLTPEDPRVRQDVAHPPLVLVGLIKEEICDDIAPSQCRIKVQWELQDQKGVVLYRTTTRAVEQQPSYDRLRHGLMLGALHSLLSRRRFALQLTDQKTEQMPTATGPLGFKQCRRPSLNLPEAARSASAPFVLVESGSNLAGGAIISGDGLVLTSAASLEPGAPLRVRFAAKQTVAAEVVALAPDADVALLRVAAQTDTTCLPLGEPLPQGAPVFGISSEPSEDRAVSLTASVVQKTSEAGVQVDARIARVSGGPLLDAEGRLVAVVASAAQSGHAAHATDVTHVLTALNIKPAAITDPRLLDRAVGPAPATHYVRDADDPPFQMTKIYTYGTGQTARRVRTIGMATTAVGAFGVAATWLSFRANQDMTEHAHDRTVLLNGASWVLLGLGAVGWGVSYAVPEGHDVVAGHSSAQRDLFLRVGAGGVTFGGRL